jgi:FMN phosphatase YigB (HAD superfamily)
VPPKTVILDFGNVVAFFDHRRACRQLAALSGRGSDEDDVFREVFETSLEHDVDAGAIPPDRFIDILRGRFWLEGTDDQIRTAWCDIFTLNEAVAALIPGLKRRGLRLMLASNTNALHFDWIAHRFAGVLTHFDALILSHQVGARKPDARFFARCLDAARADAAECLYVDDRAEFVDVARGMGMNGVVYEPGVDVGAVVDGPLPR